MKRTVWTQFSLRLFDPHLKHEMRHLLPALIADQLSATLLGIVNTLMAANADKTAVSGVAQVDAVCNVLVAVFGALAIGSSVVTAQSVGRKDKPLASKIALQTTVYGFVVALLIGLTVFFLRRPLLSVLYPLAEAAVQQASERYFFWAALSLPASFLIAQSGGLLRAIGDTRTPMLIGLVTNVLNLCAGFVLIIGVAGHPGLGAWGAGISIFLSRTVGALLSFLALLRPSPTRLQCRAGLCPDGKLLRTVLSVGIPASGESGLYYAGRLLLQTLVSTMGTAAISANQIVLSMHQLVILIPTAISMAAYTMIGVRAGAGDLDACADAQAYIHRLCTFVCCAIAAFTFCFAQKFVLLYNRNTQIVALATSALRVDAVSLFLWAPAVVPGIAMRSVGRSLFPFWVNSLTMWVFQVAFVGLIGKPLGWGINGVWVGYALSTACRAALYGAVLYKNRWLKKYRSTSLLSK
jgi:putative MATE family efflux protein